MDHADRKQRRCVMWSDREDARLDMIARHTGRSRSELVRKALRMMADRFEKDPFGIFGDDDE